MNNERFKALMLNPQAPVATTGSDHKYQPPTLKTRKRILDEMGAFGALPTPSNLLRTVAPSPEPMVIIAACYIIDRHTGSRAIMRDSLPILHKFIRGFKSPTTYGGNQKGNALRVRPVAVAETPFTLPASLQQKLSECSAYCDATDRGLINNMIVGELPMAAIF